MNRNVEKIIEKKSKGRTNRQNRLLTDIKSISIKHVCVYTFQDSTEFQIKFHEFK